MPDSAERICLLELELSPGGVPGQYRAAAKVLPPRQSEHRYSQSDITVPLEQLQALLVKENHEQYRQELTKAVFRGPENTVREGFIEARSIADCQDIPLRVRIIIDPQAVELHAIAWELLGEYGVGASVASVPDPIATSQRRFFSRYFNPRVIRTLRQSSGRLRCVMLVANPRQFNNVPLTRLDEIDVVRQCQVIDSQLQSEVELVRLTGPAASSASLLQEVRRGADIVYLVCHGEMRNDKPVLYFEKIGRELEEVDGNVLVETIAGMEMPPPRLVVFGSCDSAGGDSARRNLDERFLASIGAQMISAGVPAVIGMQGAIEQPVNEAFYKAFFRELFSDGQIERATATARQEIRNSKQWWMPALLLSKDDGQLWPSHNARQDFEEWTRLLSALERKRCIPILGSDVVPYFSNQEFLKVLEGAVRKEIGIFSSNELPWVAQQWITITQKDIYAEYDSFIQDKILESGIALKSGESLQDAVCRWGKNNPQRLPALKNLASLPFPLYLSANPDKLLEQELSSLAKNPKSGFCPWHGNLRQIQSTDANLSGDPAPENPWVYHLFGWLQGGEEDKSSVVLTEDDFFEHLIWISKNEGLLSDKIKSTLIRSSLLFLGFNLRDWEYRTLIHCITRLQGSGLLSGNTHVAVQVPLEANFEERARMQQALQDFFTKNKTIKLSIYYGSVETFTSELKRRWAERHGEESTWPVQELSR
jgi:CHAT domain/SIR2-like domain